MYNQRQAQWVVTFRISLQDWMEREIERRLATTKREVFHSVNVVEDHLRTPPKSAHPRSGTFFEAIFISGNAHDHRSIVRPSDTS
jgi:hypothetical protein